MDVRYGRAYVLGRRPAAHIGLVGELVDIATDLADMAHKPGKCRLIDRRSAGLTQGRLIQ